MQAKTTNILHQNQTTQQLQIIKEKMKNIPTKLHQSAKKDYYAQNDEILYDLQSIYSTVPFRRDFYFILFFVHHIRHLRLNSPRLEKGSFTIKQGQVA